MNTKLDRLRAMCAADLNNTFAWYTLAMELKKTDIPAALTTFEEIRNRTPAYVPNYYQYAKTLESAGELERARTIYREGMEHARKAGDMHAFGELEAALDLL